MIAERAIDVHHGINRQIPRRNKEIIWFYFTLCLLLRNTKLTMSVDGATTSVVDLYFQFLFFSLVLPCLGLMARPGCVLEPMGWITNAKALNIPARGSRGDTGGEMKDAIVLYLGTRKELRKNAQFWETPSGEKMLRFHLF